MYGTIYIQIFQEVVHAWNMYIYNKVTNVLMSLRFLATLIFHRLVTRYEFLRVIVVRALGIYDLLQKKSWQCLLNCFDLVTSQDLLLPPFNLQFKWKQKYEYIYIYMIIYINTIIINKSCIFFTYFDDLFTCSPWVLHEKLADVVCT